MMRHMPEQVGDYRLLRLIGYGASADVYLGEHLSSRRQAAVKLLRMEVPHADVASFLREASTIAHLEHPSIVRVLESGMYRDMPFLVMQHAPNGTLRGRHPKGAILTPHTILPYVQQIAAALQYAHDRQIIHRDVKPENMLLGTQNEVLLSDFGLAIILQSSSRQQSLQQVDGTLAYMAPEQFQGKPHLASDQYALATAIYEWLSGRRPFVGTAAEVQAQQMQATPERLYGRGLDISPAVEQVVLTALAKDPHRRFPSVQDFATALAQVCSGNTTVVIRSTWNIPYRRNMYFTGREEVLQRLHDALRTKKAAALTQTYALTGLGGVGKTQTAVEYAYRYHHIYKTVLWVKADSPELLHSDFATLADLLNLPEKQEQDQDRVIKAVKRWLRENTPWLLIFDNVEEPEMLRAFLPVTSNGSILLTTRAPVDDTLARSIELEKMPLDEGALFFLRRTRIIASDAFLADAQEKDAQSAQETSELLDSFPLALDQAGAYIEGTECSISEYLRLYRERRAELLAQRSPFTSRTSDHPDSVATTLALSFAKILQANPAAADLLRFCAFLHPDAIPEEIIIDGAPDLGRTLHLAVGDQIHLDLAIAALRKYSLVRRNSETHTLTIHRLVQALLKDRMNKTTERRWAERAVRAVNRAFPEVEFATWQRCQRCLPHAQVCATLIKQWDMKFPEVARLLDLAGSYLRERAQYGEAEPLLTNALDVRQQALGSEHLDVAVSLNDLALLYFHKGEYAQAESLYQRALTIRKKQLGPEHPDVATSMNNVGHIHYFIDSTKYEEAEQLLHGALAIREKTLGREHLDIALNCENLGDFYHYQGKYSNALPFYQRALEIREHLLEPQHPDIANSFYYVASIYHILGDYAQAAPLYQKAQRIYEALESEHPDFGLLLDNIGIVSTHLSDYDQAEQFFKRSLAIHEKALGLVHPHIAKCLDNFALLYLALARYSEAEALIQRALAIHEQTVGPTHADVAIVLNTLARIYITRGKYVQTKPLLQRALAILEEDTRPHHPLLAQTYNNMAALSAIEANYQQAETFYEKARTILAQAMGVEHPEVAETLASMAKLYLALGQYEQVENLCQNALNIWEKAFGFDHPDQAQGLNIQASLSHLQGNYARAEELGKRTLTIYEQTFGPWHPRVAQSLTILAKVYQARNNPSKARALHERALAILERSFGPDHLHLAQNLMGLAELYYAQRMHKKAEKYGKQALAIRQKTLGLEHPDIIQSSHILAQIYHAQGKNAEAEAED